MVNLFEEAASEATRQTFLNRRALAGLVPVRDPIRHVFDAYVVDPLAVVDRGLFVPRDKTLVVGHGATIVGAIEGEGRVHLGKDVVVRGGIKSASDVVVGANTRVEGDVVSATYVLVQGGAVITGRIESGGDVRIMGARIGGRVTAAGDIEVLTGTVTLALKAGGRIRTLPSPTEDHVRDP